MPESHPPDLRVKLFGGPVLLQGETEVPLSPYQSYLIALVYGHGPRGLSGAKAARLLWQEEDAAQTRHRLSQLRYNIRQKIGGRLIIRRRQHQLLANSPAVQSDWIDSTSHTADLQHVHPGETFLEFLPPLLPTKGMEDWVQSVRITQQHRHSQCLRAQLSRMRHLGDAQRCRELAHSVLSDSPGDHDALRALVWALLRDNRPTEARRQLARWTSVIHRTSPDWSPPDDLLQLLEKTTSIISPKTADKSPSLIGRTAELASATDSILSTSAWNTLVFSGDPGIGRTRFFAELGARLCSEGKDVISVRCHEAEREISFNLIAEILESPRVRVFFVDLPHPWQAICHNVFPCVTADADKATHSSIRDPVSNARHVHDALEQLFRLATSQEGLVLLIDDFHWIDASSASALNFLSRRLSRQGISLVLSIPTQGIDNNHPAASFIRTLDSVHATWHVLRPLEPKEVDALLQSTFGEQLQRAERRAIADLSMGVPLFALEIAEDRLSGTGPDHQSQLMTTKSAEVLFRRRRDALSPPARHVLRLLAVAGRPLPHAAVARCAGLPRAEFLVAFESLQAQRLVSDQETGITIPPQLVRGAVYNELSDTVRRMYHAAIASLLEGSPEIADPSEIAVHFRDAGIPARAAAYARLAAEESSHKGAFEQAMRMLEIAVSSARGNPEEFQSLMHLGTLCHFQGQHARAAHHFNLAFVAADDSPKASRARLATLRARIEIPGVDLAPIAEEAEQIASLEIQRAGDVYLSLTALDLVLRIADYSFDNRAAVRVLSVVDDVETSRENPETRCLREIIRTRHICYGHPDTAVDAARSAVGIAENNRLVDEFGQAVKRFLVVLGYRGLLDGEEGRKNLDKAIRGFQGRGDECGMFDVLINYGAWLSDTGRFEEARKYFLEAGEIVRDLEDSPEHAVFSCNMGEYYLYQRDYLSARQHYRAAWRAEPNGRRLTRWMAAAGLGLCALETGDLQEVAELDQAIPPDTFIQASPIFDPTPIALFRSRRLELQRGPRQAVELLRRYSCSLEGRVVPAWLKITLAEVRLRRKHRLKGIRKIATPAQDLALALGLTDPARLFDQYLT